VFYSKRFPRSFEFKRAILPLLCWPLFASVDYCVDHCVIVTLYTPSSERISTVCIQVWSVDILSLNNVYKCSHISTKYTDTPNIQIRCMFKVSAMVILLLLKNTVFPTPRIPDRIFQDWQYCAINSNYLGNHSE